MNLKEISSEIKAGLGDAQTIISKVTEYLPVLEAIAPQDADELKAVQQAANDLAPLVKAALDANVISQDTHDTLQNRLGAVAVNTTVAQPAEEITTPAPTGLAAIVAAFLILLGCSAQAQTNAPNEVTKTIAAVSPTGAAVVSDAYNFFAASADLYTNNVIAFEAFGLHSSGTQKYGGGFDVQIPLSNFQPDGSNPSAVLSQSFIGFSLYGFGGNFYDGTANFGIGNNFNVPVVGEVYGFFEAGPGRNLSTGQTIGTAFAGVKYPIPLYKVWPSTKNIVWTIGYAHGDITDQSGQIDAIGTEVVMPLEPIQNFVIGLLQKIKL